MKKIGKFFGVLLAVVLMLQSATVYAGGADEPEYLIRVNRAANCVTAYARDEAGEYTVPVIAFVCSTGLRNKTLLGNYSVTAIYDGWKLMNHGVYTQNAVRFNRGIMFHSEYYRRKDKSTMAWEQFNLLGDFASAGCVRLACIDSQWVHDNCPVGTLVEVYDDADDPGPLGKPRTIEIAADCPYRGWDPTDPDEENPWCEVRPVLLSNVNTDGDGALRLTAGASFAELEGIIGLYTPEGVPYADYTLEIYGQYDLNTPGDYELFVRGFDTELTMRADRTFTLRVAGSDMD